MSKVEQKTRSDAAAEAPRPRRRLLHWISALVLTTSMGAAGYLLLHWEHRHLPVQVVKVDGEVRRLSRERLQETVLGHLHGGILTQDLSELKEAVEALPWVRSASLRRLWPDALELAVQEREPLARWGADGLVTADGVVFRPEDGKLPQGLVRLDGMDDKAPTVVGRFLSWAPRFKALGLAIENLALDARGAWSMRFGAGFSLALGSSRLDERVDRFLRAYAPLAAAGRPDQIDMRYSNGLAVRWSDEETDGQGPGVGDAAQTAKFDSRPAASGPGQPEQTPIIGHPGQDQQGIRKRGFRMPSYSVAYAPGNGDASLRRRKR